MTCAPAYSVKQLEEDATYAKIHVSFVKSGKPYRPWVRASMTGINEYLDTFQASLGQRREAHHRRCKNQNRNKNQ